jgi:hypothetical protein
VSFSSPKQVNKTSVWLIRVRREIKWRATALHEHQTLLARKKISLKVAAKVVVFVWLRVTCCVFDKIATPPNHHRCGGAFEIEPNYGRGLACLEKAIRLLRCQDCRLDKLLLSARAHIAYVTARSSSPREDI